MACQAAFTIYFGHDYAGYDLPGNPVAAGTSADACEALCYQNSQCQSFTWIGEIVAPSLSWPVGLNIALCTWILCNRVLPVAIPQREVHKGKIEQRVGCVSRELVAKSVTHGRPAAAPAD